MISGRWQLSDAAYADTKSGTVLLTTHPQEIKANSGSRLLLDKYVHPTAGLKNEVQQPIGIEIAHRDAQFSKGSYRTYGLLRLKCPVSVPQKDYELGAAPGILRHQQIGFAVGIDIPNSKRKLPLPREIGCVENRWLERSVAVAEHNSDLALRAEGYVKLPIAIGVAYLRASLLVGGDAAEATV